MQPDSNKTASAIPGAVQIIDKHWVEKFPEHKDYLGETIVHHHLDYGKNAIPLLRLCTKSICAR
ncbi:hypothetical protein K5D50_24850 [Pseudomonas cichorii]|nr:hypothetical protein [Pseudomonas cichorii]